MTGRTDVFIDEVKNVLEENILKFWIDKMQDPRGGFYGQIGDDGTIVEDSPKGAVLNARILWAFSAAYRILRKKEYLMVATRAKDYFIEHFIDHKHGGVYWYLNADGSRLDTQKQFHALGFAIYGLSEYVRATNDENVLKYAVNLYETMEKEGLDKENNGYLEALTRDWHEIQEDARETAKGKRTMNTHLHILEAYTNLYRIWRNESLKDSIINLLDILTDKIWDARSGHLGLVFNETWQPESSGHSFGHDIEASWLILDAAFTVGDIDKVNKVRPVAQHLAKASFEGLQDDGSMIQGHGCGTRPETDILWWVQAEAITGYLWMWKYMNVKEASDKVFSCWQYISASLNENDGKDWAWKCEAPKYPYHSTRMCLEVLGLFR